MVRWLSCRIIPRNVCTVEGVVKSVDTEVKDLAKLYWYSYFQISSCG